MKKITFVVLILLSFFSCTSDEIIETKSDDLQEKIKPISLTTPPSYIETSTSNLSICHPGFIDFTEVGNFTYNTFWTINNNNCSQNNNSIDCILDDLFAQSFYFNTSSSFVNHINKPITHVVEFAIWENGVSGLPPPYPYPYLGSNITTQRA